LLFNLLIKGLEKLVADLAFKLSAVSNAIKDDIPDVIEMDEIFTYIKKNSKGLSSGLLILGAKVASFPITSAKE
jgi:hypothetical protein